MAQLPSPVILLVEDSEDDAFFFRHALAKAGAAPALFHVADGTAAIRYLEQAWANRAGASHPWPDLVFLDLKLPGFSGFEILNFIRERQMAPLAVTVLSGSEHASDVERATALGATAYVVKPITTDYLKDCLARWHPLPRVTSAATS